jgi:hypothetical protein
MEKRFRQMSVREESDFEAVGKIHASFELPVADEFVCTDDEVREACAVLEGAHESFLD